MHFLMLSQISFALFQFFLIFFILKNEGVNVLGFYGLFISILNPLQQFFKLGVPKLIVTAFKLKDQKRYYIISYFSFVLFMISGVIISLFFLNNDYYNLFFALLMFRSLINFRESQQSIYIRNNLFKDYFHSAFVCNILMIFFFWVSYVYFNSLAISFFVCCSIIVLFLIIDLLKQQNLIRLSINDFTNLEGFRSSIIKMTKLSIADGLFTVKSNLPRYILATNFSIDMLGIYTALFQLVSVFEILNQAVLKFYYGSLTEMFKKNLIKFKRIEKKIYLITTVFIIGGLICFNLFENFLLETFLSTEFLIHYNVFFILIFERYFGMLNSIPKAVYILLDKIQVNIYTNLVIFLIMFFVLSSITDFVIFNLFISIFAFIQFALNKVIIKRLMNNE